MELPRSEILRHIGRVYGQLQAELRQIEEEIAQYTKKRKLGKEEEEATTDNRRRPEAQYTKKEKTKSIIHRFQSYPKTNNPKNLQKKTRNYDVGASGAHGKKYPYLERRLSQKDDELAERQREKRQELRNQIQRLYVLNK